MAGLSARGSAPIRSGKQSNIHVAVVVGSIRFGHGVPPNVGWDKLTGFSELCHDKALQLQTRLLS